MDHPYQVKAIKSGIGHDRAGWQCSFYREGRRIASVCDDGWGGEVDFEWFDREDVVETPCRVSITGEDHPDGGTYKVSREEARLIAFCKKLPKWKCGDEDAWTSPEIFIEGLINEELDRRYWRRLCRTQVLYRTSEDEADEELDENAWRTLRIKDGRSRRARNMKPNEELRFEGEMIGPFEYLRTRHGDEIRILNEEVAA
jgi:hypothetical protein